MSLNPYVKQKWVKALRGGEYTRGEGALIRLDDDGDVTHYCCLGVLAAEMVPEFTVLPDLDDDQGCVLTQGARRDYATIPDDLAVMWGLEEDEQTKLAEMNDGGKGFKAIAAWIDKHL